MKQFSISVPASSANLGPAFDSAGIALNLYLTLHVTESEKWEFETRSPLLPPELSYEDNLIYKIAKQTAERHNKQLPACKVIVNSDIPLARGFGSSASAILAGIEIANQMCNLSLSIEDKLLYGTEVEGHPDNIAPALFGGFTVSVQTLEHEVDWVQLPLPKTDVVAYIPNFELKTEAAREVLPDNYYKKNAIAASSISNLLIAALATSDYKLAGKMMEQDLFHEPFRAELIPLYHDIKKEAKGAGAYGTVISGAGPTMISFTPDGKGNAIAEQMKTLLPEYEVASLKIDPNGVQIKHLNEMAAEE
ncbi:homoserine kinase [Virgibacillus ainsalahensis]